MYSSACRFATRSISPGWVGCHKRTGQSGRVRSACLCAASSHVHRFAPSGRNVCQVSGAVAELRIGEPSFTHWATRFAEAGHHDTGRGPEPEKRAMTIAVACECGKRLSAKDELAGKRVKCPACGQGLLIPAPDSAPQPETE